MTASSVYVYEYLPPDTAMEWEVGVVCCRNLDWASRADHVATWFMPHFEYRFNSNGSTNFWSGP